LPSFTDADTLGHRAGAGKPHAPSQRVAIGPQLPRQRLVDDRHGREISRIAIVERAARDHRDLRGREVFRRHGHGEREAFLARRWSGLAVRLQRRLVHCRS
jgi:hypothetical protein